jgi:hypothetical protein
MEESMTCTLSESCKRFEVSLSSLIVMVQHWHHDAPAFWEHNGARSALGHTDRWRQQRELDKHQMYGWCHLYTCCTSWGGGGYRTEHYSTLACFNLRMNIPQSIEIEECHLLGWSAVCPLLESTFRMTVTPLSSGWKESALILSTLMMEVIHSSEKSVLTRSMRKILLTFLARWFFPPWFWMR